MTALEESVASGQVSPAQIEAHRVAGDLPITMHEPMSAAKKLFTSWDAEANEAERIALRDRVANLKPQTLRDVIDGATDEQAHVWCKVSDVRAALDDAERYRSLVQIGVTETASIRERRNGCILWFGPSVESGPTGTAIYAAIKATS